MNEQRKEQPAVQEAPAQPIRKRGGWKKLFKGKGRKLLALVLVVAVAAGFLAYKNKGSQQAAAATVYQEAEMEHRTITKSLSSSGSLEPADSYTVSTLVDAEILSDTFEEGDLVEKGQLLYTLDSSDASSSLTQSQNSLTQAQNNYDQAVKNKYPTADMSGTVSEVYVKNGDTVNAGTALLKIVGDNNIYMNFIFTYANNGDFYVGQPATVFINDMEGSISGTVVAVSSGSTVSDIGRVMTTVRVKANNPGLVTASYTARAAIGSYSSYGNAAVELSATSTITAETSGKVSELNWLAGDTISSGDRVCTITGDSVDNSIENARISVSNAGSSLQNAQDRLSDYEITAPISGTVVTKTAKAGDKIEGGSSGTLCTIYDLSYLEMTMSIDELDISQVAVGQSVQITADAVKGKTYTGVVTKVSVAGISAGGITSYPVTVRIDETDGLLPGMNVDAEIVIEEREDTLAIPASAVNRGNTVLVTADSPSAANATDQEAPEGYAYVEVETGISDGSYIEVLSGLQEGDTVAYLQVSGGSDAAMMMGGMPGMSSGMPGGGGMSGGGMPSGGGGMSGGRGGGPMG